MIKDQQHTNHFTNREGYSEKKKALFLPQAMWQITTINKFEQSLH